MRKPFFSIISCLLLLLKVMPHASAAEIIDRVVASVGDDAITLYDVEKEGAALLNQIEISSPPEEREGRLYETRKRIVEQLVEKVLLLREADRLGIEVDEEEIDSAIDKVKAENRISQEELLRALEAEGLTYERYRKEMKGQILRAKVVDRRVRGGIDVSDDDVRAYYERNMDDYRTDEDIRVRHILFLVPKGAGDNTVYEARKRAIEVLRMAKGGEGFASLARKYSEGPSAPEGGDLGFFKREDMVREFSDAAFALKEGEISDLVRTPFGFHIIKLIERRGDSPLSLDEVKEKIRTRLYSEEMERGVKELIRELRERGEVEIRI